MAEQVPDGATRPRLDEDDLAKLEPYATRRAFRDGETLFKAGDLEPRFFVIRSGRVRISDGSGRTLAVHGPGEFTGDTEIVTGRPTIVTAVAEGECQVDEIPAADLTSILTTIPELSDRILRAFLARREAIDRTGAAGLRVIGSRYSQDTFRVKEFLAKNKVRFQWVDAEREAETDAIFRRLRVRSADLPIVLGKQGLVLRNPSNLELGERLGIVKPAEDALYDLAIVGAGPAGLAAAVYAASEGLKTIVLDRLAPGGQAGCSSKIENYLGFPAGISGTDLAERAVLQATKFGARITAPASVAGLESAGGLHVLPTEEGERVVSRCVLVATGVSYRTLEIDGCQKFAGSGVYYSATANESQLCCGADAVVVGGGNSAGQAAMHLSGQARKVWLLIRGDDLNEGMSRYLVERIEQAENIELLAHTEAVRMCGEERLKSVRARDNRTGAERDLEASAVFMFVGAEAHTQWLPADVERDEQGFVRTGPQLAGSKAWPLEREPFLLETSRPGVFAAGDVRSGSVKRVASAVGEGAMVVPFIHQLLSE